MYIDIKNIDIYQISLDFNISQRNVLKSLEDYNIRFESKHNNYQGEVLNKIPKEYKGKYFYHFTHIENLESILKNGFLSTNKKNKLAIKHKNIAYESIQSRRSTMTVLCPPSGKVHDYVPFYFTTINPMLLGLLNNKNIDQPFIIFFAISIEKLLEENVVFTSSSANTTTSPIFYNNPKDLNKLDWDAIDSKKWGVANETERHKRMAEVLIYDSVPLEWIDNIIIFNKSIKDYIEKIYTECKIDLPNIEYQPFSRRYFYFTKFFFEDRKNETLITGPYMLNHKVTKLIENLITKRISLSSPKFKNIEDAISQIENNFCIIDELQGIYQLETKNEIHSENVSDHTLKVVENLKKDNTYYSSLSDNDKKIVKLSAYLHDIGKGPKSKWKDKKQEAYADHPADAIPMLKRILSEDFQELSEYEIRKVCLLVVYHDLIGDVLGRKRSREELIDLVKDENELNMLISISLADILAINLTWFTDVYGKLTNTFKKEILEKQG